METFPVTAESTVDASKGPCLNYRMRLFDSGQMDVTLTLAPTLNFVPDRGLRVAVGIDAGQMRVVDTLGKNAEGDWSRWVSDGVRRVKVPIEIGPAGEHTLHVCRVDAAIAMERVMVSRGAVAATYLGPPESFQAGSQEAP